MPDQDTDAFAFQSVYIKLGQHDERLQSHERSLEDMRVQYRAFAANVEKHLSDQDIRQAAWQKEIQQKLAEQDAHQLAWQEETNKKLLPLVSMTTFLTDMKTFMDESKEREEQRRIHIQRLEDQQRKTRQQLYAGFESMGTKIAIPILVAVLIPTLIEQYSKVTDAYRWVMLTTILLLILWFIGAPLWRLLHPQQVDANP